MGASAESAYAHGMEKPYRRRQRDAAQWLKIIEAWQASGLGAEAYARTRDFSASRLYFWKKHLGFEGKSNSKPAFVAVEVQDEDVPSESAEWHIKTRKGVLISMSGVGAAEGLQIALRSLGEHEAL